MIGCICRAILPSDFETEEEFEAAILEDDFVCGRCVESLSQTIEKREKTHKNTSS